MDKRSNLFWQVSVTKKNLYIPFAGAIPTNICKFTHFLYVRPFHTSQHYVRFVIKRSILQKKSEGIGSFEGLAPGIK